MREEQLEGLDARLWEEERGRPGGRVRGVGGRVGGAGRRARVGVGRKGVDGELPLVLRKEPLCDEPVHDNLGHLNERGRLAPNVHVVRAHPLVQREEVIH